MGKLFVKYQIMIALAFYAVSAYANETPFISPSDKAVCEDNMTAISAVQREIFQIIQEEYELICEKQIILDPEPINNDELTDYVVYLGSSVWTNTKGELTILIATGELDGGFSVFQLPVRTAYRPSQSGPQFIRDLSVDFNQFTISRSTDHLEYWEYDSNLGSYVKAK